MTELFDFEDGLGPVPASRHRSMPTEAIPAPMASAGMAVMGAFQISVRNMRARVEGPDRAPSTGSLPEENSSEPPVVVHAHAISDEAGTTVVAVMLYQPLRIGVFCGRTWLSARGMFGVGTPIIASQFQISAPPDASAVF